MVVVSLLVRAPPSLFNYLVVRCRCYAKHWKFKLTCALAASSSPLRTIFVCLSCYTISNRVYDANFEHIIALELAQPSFIFCTTCLRKPYNSLFLLSSSFFPYIKSSFVNHVSHLHSYLTFQSYRQSSENFREKLMKMSIKLSIRKYKISKVLPKCQKFWNPKNCIKCWKNYEKLVQLQIIKLSFFKDPSFFLRSLLSHFLTLLSKKSSYNSCRSRYQK